MVELSQPSQATLRDDAPVRPGRGGRIAFMDGSDRKDRR